MRVQIGDRAYEVEIIGDGTVSVDGDKTLTAWVARGDGVQWVYIDGRVYEIAEQTQDEGPRRRSTSHQGAMSAPMPATVRKLAVAPGDTVKAGDLVIVLEAMKMELPIRAATAGTVTAIHCHEGQLVQPGVTLIDIAEGEAAS